MKKIASILITLVMVTGLFSCSSKPDETIIAKIGDKTISLNEFIRRSEYTVRPLYCKNDNNLDKKIILNSLIAEKLLSIEAGNENEFINRPALQTYLLGRKEQAMRQLLYDKEVKSKVVVDTNKIKNTFKYVGREYEISYVSLSDSNVVKQLTEELIIDKTNFETTLKENYKLEKIPDKKVAWSNLEHPEVLNSLFTKDLKKGDVIGPVKIDNGYYMFFKIIGWINTPAVTSEQVQNRYNSVKKTYESIESKKLYESYIRRVMKGKSLNFNRDVFFALTDILGPLYTRTMSEREELFKNGVWSGSSQDGLYKESKPKLEEIKNEILFEINDEQWTVDDFLIALRTHPLVFRDKKFPNKEFGREFQMAILDLVRDKYLTEEAYKSNLDNTVEVKRDQQMWFDYLNSINVKQSILKNSSVDSLSIGDEVFVMDNILKPYIDKLQKKYSDQIFVNVELFNKVKLTKIDMAVTYTDAPYPQVVPGFPILTNDNKLDYGSSL